MKKIIYILLFTCGILQAQVLEYGRDPNGVAIPIKVDTDGVLDVNVQDQTSGPFHRYFMTEEKADITLVDTISVDDTSFVASSSHGFVVGKTALILYGDYYQQSEVTSVDNDTIGIESMIGIEIPPTGTQIIRGSIEMNVDGSTPVTFYCRTGANSQPVDIQHIHVFMQDNAEGDDSKYGGITALAKGTFARFTDGINQNLGNYKENSDFVEYGANSSYTNKAGGGNYSMDFAFDIKDIYGVVFRLDPAENGLLSITIRDNLTDLLLHRVVATGQITVGE